MDVSPIIKIVDSLLTAGRDGPRAIPHETYRVVYSPSVRSTTAPGRRRTHPCQQAGGCTTSAAGNRCRYAISPLAR